MLNLAERIKGLRLKHGLTQTQLGKLVGLKQQAIQKMESNRIRNPRDIEKIADALGVTPAWLRFGDAEKESVANVSSTNINLSWIPIISWVNAGHWGLAQEQSQDDIELIPVSKKLDGKAFALKIQGDSMTSPNPDNISFVEGSIIVIEPERWVKHNDYVVALLPESNEATFKQYIVKDGQAYLKPLNPAYPTVPFPKSGTICGVVAAHMNFY